MGMDKCGMHMLCTNTVGSFRVSCPDSLQMNPTTQKCEGKSIFLLSYDIFVTYVGVSF